jgi:tetratricopeptide (TPR) repeat protein
VIASAEAEGNAEVDAYDEAISAALRKHRHAFSRVQLDREKRARRLVQLQELPLPQRLLWIENTPTAWADAALGEQGFGLAREALPHHPEISLEWAVTARKLAERYTRPHAGHRCLALAFEGNAHRALGDYRTARPLIRAAVAGVVDGQVSDIEIVADIHSFAGSLASNDSAFEQAIEHLETAADAYLLAQHSEGMIRVSMQLGSLYGLIGDLEAALQTERSLLAALDPDHRFYLLLVSNLADHLQQAGRGQAARNLLDLEGPRLAELPEPSRTRITWLQARLSMEDGELATAETLLELVRDAFARQGNTFDFAHSSLELALVHLRQKRPDAVARVAGQALRLFAASDHQQDALAALTMVARSAADGALTAERLQRAIALFVGGGRRRSS